MLNYTEALTVLARDITSRVPALSFLDIDRMLIFGRVGRGDVEGANASCHCLCLPEDEPGYYFWRDQATGVVTRRTEWFVARTPVVQRTGTRLDYLISVALPRFCDQRLGQGRKAALYPGAEAYVAKLDTLVHELYHIDPQRQGIRPLPDACDGAGAGRQHSEAFYRNVAGFVRTYLQSQPDPAIYEFLRYDFAGLRARYGSVVATAFRNFPSYPQIYLERLAEQPAGPDTAVIVPVKVPRQPVRYADADIMIREFSAHGSRRLRVADLRSTVAASVPPPEVVPAAFAGAGARGARFTPASHDTLGA